MESVTIKVHKAMLDEIERNLQPDYGTKSEFIREAVREKLKKQREDKLIQELRKGLGSVKIKTTKKEEQAVRQAVGREIASRLGIKLD